jgi:hypothetical protein
LAIGEIERDKSQWELIVVDGIRNVGEIEVLRERLGQHFHLIALECPQSERWRRLTSAYENKGLTLEDFQRDNEQDQPPGNTLTGNRFNCASTKITQTERANSRKTITEEDFIRTKTVNPLPP